jgi:hypothetical protein
MEYVSKRIAEIAKEKGFNINTIYYYSSDPEIGLTFQFGTHIFNHNTSIDKISKPTYQQLIEWIFKLANTIECDLEDNIEWLEFWYNTLISELNKPKTGECFDCIHAYYVCTLLNGESIGEGIRKDCPLPNEFILEGFIGMLLNWFEKNNYIISINNFNCWFGIYHKEEILNPTMIDEDGYKHICSERTDNKQQAMHKGILKVFELLKRPE